MHTFVFCISLEKVSGLCIGYPYFWAMICKSAYPRDCEQLELPMSSEGDERHVHLKIEVRDAVHQAERWRRLEFSRVGPIWSYGEGIRGEQRKRDVTNHTLDSPATPAAAASHSGQGEQKMNNAIKKMMNSSRWQFGTRDMIKSTDPDEQR